MVLTAPLPLHCSRLIIYYAKKTTKKKIKKKSEGERKKEEKNIYIFFIGIEAFSSFHKSIE